LWLITWQHTANGEAARSTQQRKTNIPLERHRVRCIRNGRVRMESSKTMHVCNETESR
jgi:hypothetical protein